MAKIKKAQNGAREKTRTVYRNPDNTYKTVVKSKSGPGMMEKSVRETRTFKGLMKGVPKKSGALDNRNNTAPLIVEQEQRPKIAKNGAKSPAWQRKEGKSPSGGLNAKGRASLKAEGHNIKPPQPGGGPRKKSFCARMSGMKKKLTSSKTANDPNSRINKSLRKWKC